MRNRAFLKSTNHNPCSFSGITAREADDTLGTPASNTQTMGGTHHWTYDIPSAASIKAGLWALDVFLNTAGSASTLQVIIRVRDSSCSVVTTVYDDTRLISNTSSQRHRFSANMPEIELESGGHIQISFVNTSPGFDDIELQYGGASGYESLLSWPEEDTDPKIRVLVDWNNDKFVNLEVKDTAFAANRLPAPYYREISVNQDIGGLPPVSVSSGNFKSLGGHYHFYVHVDDPTYNDGIRLGGAVPLQEIPVSPNTDYTFSLEYRAQTVITDGDLYLQMFFYDSVDNFITGNTAVITSPLATSFTPISVSHNSGAGANHVLLRLIQPNYEIGMTDYYLVIQKMQFIEGSSPTYYNTGDQSDAYNDVTPYLRSARWSIGSTDSQRRVSDEGTASIVLDNSDKLFSPEVSTNPIASDIRANRRIYIEMKHPTTGAWTRMFTGFISDIQPDPGTANDPTISIGATQRMNRVLDSDIFIPQLYRNARTLDIVEKELFDEAVLYGPNVAVGAVIGTSAIQKDFGIADDSHYIAEKTSSSFQLTNFGLGLETVEDAISLRTLMERMAEIDHSYILLDREAAFRLLDFTDLQGRSTPDHTINLGTQANEIRYVFGVNIYNVIKATYTEYEQLEHGYVYNIINRIFEDSSANTAYGYTDIRKPDATISAGATDTIRLSPNLKEDTNIVTLPSGDLYKDLEDAGREEIAVWWEDDAKTPINWTEVDWPVVQWTLGSPPAIAATVSKLDGTKLSAGEKANITVTTRGFDPETFELEIEVNNANGFDVHWLFWFWIGYTESTLEQYTEDRDEDSIHDSGGAYPFSLDLPTMTETEVNSVIDRYLSLYKDPYGEFVNFSLMNRDNTWYANQLDIKVGDTVDLQDGQVVDTNTMHLIIGENHSYTPTILRSEFYCANIERF